MATRSAKKNQVLLTGRNAYGTDGIDAYALKVDTSGRQVLGASSGVDIGDTDVTSLPNMELTVHPFGKGSLTTTGVQWSTALTTAASTAYVAVETATITIPVLGTPNEVELGLTGATACAGTVDTPKWKWQASDDNASWQDLIAEQTGTAATTMAEATVSGRFAPTGNFLANTTPVYVRMVIKAGGATNLAWGKTKNSSYITFNYRV